MASLKKRLIQIRDELNDTHSKDAAYDINLAIEEIRKLKRKLKKITRQLNVGGRGIEPPP